jgi:Zn-dependent protease with chaperone function
MTLANLVICSGCIFGSSSKNSSKISSQDSQRIVKLLLEKYNGFYSISPVPAYATMDPQLWAKEIYPQQLGSGSEPKLLNEDHAGVQLLQTFVHRIHSALLEQIPEFKNVPEPKIVVVSESIPNAFVTSALYCAPIEVKSKESTQLDESKSSWIMLADRVFEGNDFKDSPPGPSGCPAGTITRPDLLQFMVNSLQTQEPSCKLQNRDGTIFLENSCYQKVSKGGKIQGIVYWAQAAMVVVYSKLLKTFEQQHMEAVIAHELAHYYRRHSFSYFSEKRDESHFFRIADYTHRGSRPKPDSSPEITQLAELLRKSGAWMTGRFPEQKYHPDIWDITDSLCFYYDHSLRKRNMPVPPAFNKACADFKRASNATLPSHQRHESGLRNLSRSERLEIDKSIATVLQTMSHKTIGELVKLYGPKESEIAYIRNKTLWRLYEYYSAAIPPSVDNLTVLEPINELNVSLLEKERQVRELISKAQELGFGWYTKEIEADEIAAYLLSIAGMDPNQTIDLWFKFESVSSTSLGPTIEECRKSFLNGWKHWVFNGKPWVPFWGIPEDLHPSKCFRAYNVDLEIRGQNLPRGRYTRSSDEWRLMQSSLK